MAENKALEIWEKAWAPEVHTTDYALKRIASAKSAKLTPLKIDTTNFYGYFQGGHGRYETFLNTCPCGDFIRSHLPCKHIYRLAAELGLMDIEVKNDANAVLVPKKERTSLKDTINIVESLSDGAQKKLLLISNEINSQHTTYLIAETPEITELIDSGIAIADQDKYEINFGKKNEIISLLNDENVPYSPKALKNELTELCIQHIPEKAAERFGKKLYVSIPTKFSPQNIHNYLHRKLEVLEYRDYLPDDAITYELESRGYYERKR